MPPYEKAAGKILSLAESQISGKKEHKRLVFKVESIYVFVSGQSLQRIQRKSFRKCGKELEQENPSESFERRREVRKSGCLHQSVSRLFILRLKGRTTVRYTKVS